MQTHIKFFIGAIFIWGITSCSGVKLPLRKDIPSSISNDIKTNIEGLYSSTSKRAYSAYYLGEMGQRAAPAIPYLVRILGDDTQLEDVEERLFDFLEGETPRNVARIAAVALIKIGRPALQQLIRALNDDDKLIRRWAQIALEDIDPYWTKSKTAKDRLPHMPGALKNKKPHIRANNTEALGKIKDSRSVDALIEALKDDNANVRANAVLALGATGDSRAIQPLIFALKDNASRVRWQSRNALGKMGMPATAPLIAVLKDEQVSVQERAEEALGEIGEPAIIPMIGVLEDGSASVRSRAVTILGRIGKPAVNSLIAALRDKNPTVRYGAIQVLMIINDPRAITPLIAMLTDTNPDVARISAETLGLARAKQAVEPLIAILTDRYYHKSVRDWAGWALGEIKDIRAVKPLIKALKDNSKLVQRSAADALGKFGKPALKVLITTLKDHDCTIRLGAAKSLEMINWQPEDETEKAWFFIASQKFEEAVNLESAAVKPLTIALKDNDWRIRRKAAWALGMIEDWEPDNTMDKIWFLIASRKLDAVSDFGVQAVPPLILALRGESKQIRELAGNELKEIGKSAVVPLAAALKDENWNVRRKVSEILGMIGDDRAVEALIESLNDEDWYVRAKSAEALGDIDDSRAIIPLIGLLKDETSDVRKKTAQALYSMYWQAPNNTEEALFLIALEDWYGVVRLGAAAIEPLISMFKDEDHNVRKRAGETLVMIGKEAVAPLIATLDNEDADARRGAVETLGRIGDRQAVEFLIATLDDKLPDVRRRAAKALGELKDPSAIAPLKKLVEEDPNSIVRREAEEALKEIQHKEETQTDETPPQSSEEKIEFYEY